MKKLIILLSFISLGVSSGFAQGYFAVHYDVSIPLGTTSDEVGKVSFRGVGMDYRRMVNPNLAVGFTVGWQVFYEQKNYATYVDGTTSLSGVQYSYLNAIPLHLNLNYYLGDQGDDIRPFAGIGVGTTYFEREIEMGLYTSSTKTWQFSIQPEAGLLYQVNPSANVFVAAKYTQGFKNSELDAQSYISLNFGIAWQLN